MSSELPTGSLGTPDLGQKIEDYPTGYPRFAALISSHPSFFVFRRFSAVRARLLLFKQDEITQLELELKNIDATEPKLLYNGCRRRDRNETRKSVLAKLETAVAEYDDLIERTRQALSFKSAKDRNVLNLRTWLASFGCISREETKYLWGKDLISVGPSDPDEFLDTVGSLLEDFIIWLSGILNIDLRTGASRDPHMHIFSEGPIKTFSRFILAVIPLTILLIPIVIVSLVKTTGVRLVIIFLANAIFVMILSVLARPRIGELFVAGATYAAVLIVYVAGSTS